MNMSWDDRYNREEYIFGEAPNAFFAEQISKLSAGTLLLPCEGEGRNAVFAASRGWKVEAFDSSRTGQSKALKLAGKNNVHIDYIIADAMTIDYPENSIDLVALIYAHFAPNDRSSFHRKVLRWLKPGGTIILEAYQPEQLQFSSGGPKDPALLYTTDMMREDFEGLSFEILETIQKDLQEGKDHQGMAAILRMTGTKI